MSLPWSGIESFLKALGADLQEREGLHIAVMLFGEVRVFHRPFTEYRQGRSGQHPQVVGKERRDPVTTS